MGKEGHTFKPEWNEKGGGGGYFRQVIEGGVVQVGALRGQEGANGAR